MIVNRLYILYIVAGFTLLLHYLSICLIKIKQTELPMEFQSKKEISQKKFKEIALSITAYGIISSLLVFFVTKAQVGIEEAFIL